MEKEMYLALENGGQDNITLCLARREADHR